MQEGFNLAVGFARDGADFRDRQFARESHPLEAEADGRAHAGQIVQRHLRGGMSAQRRKMFARQPRHAGILHDDGIGPDFGAERKGAEQVRQFGVVEQGVERHIHAARPRQGVGVGNDFFQLARGEVDRTSARGKAWQTGIDGIRAKREGGISGGAFAGGREQFRGAGGGAHVFSSASAIRAAVVSRAICAAAASASAKT